MDYLKRIEAIQGEKTELNKLNKCQFVMPLTKKIDVPPNSIGTPQPGWLVAYWDQDGRLRGGCDEREHGTVQQCRWDGVEWILRLTEGQQFSLRIVRSVARTDADGRILAAWTVDRHGFDGRTETPCTDRS